MRPFRTQNGIRRKDCFTILHNERSQERYGNYINGFSEDYLIQGNLVILAQNGYLHPHLDLLSGCCFDFAQ